MIFIQSIRILRYSVHAIGRVWWATWVVEWKSAGVQLKKPDRWSTRY